VIAPGVYITPAGTTVTAIQWTGRNIRATADFIGTSEHLHADTTTRRLHWTAAPGEQPWRVPAGWWIVRHPDGTLTIYEPQVFRHRYELIWRPRIMWLTWAVALAGWTLLATGLITGAWPLACIGMLVIAADATTAALHTAATLERATRRTAWRAAAAGGTDPDGPAAPVIPLGRHRA